MSDLAARIERAKAAIERERELAEAFVPLADLAPGPRLTVAILRTIRVCDASRRIERHCITRDGRCHTCRADWPCPELTWLLDAWAPEDAS